MTTKERILPKYRIVDGVRLAHAFYPQALRDTINYKPQADDIFLVTYPKCGTNWLCYIITLILKKGESPKSKEELFRCCPFPELFGIESVATMHRPGVIKTHLPFQLTPYSPEAKYIFVARNPKDCCVSFYHHTESTGALYEFEGGEFDDYFEVFMKGEVDYGDYFDHVMLWYKHHNDPNVLWLTYEEMKADTSGVILKVAKMLGEEYSKLLESNPNLVQKIVENSNVKNMKAVTDELGTEVAGSMDPAKMTPTMKHLASIYAKHGKPKAFQMVRKGIVGDWRNAMNAEQIKRIDERTEQRMGGTELLKYWKDIGAV